MSFVVPAFLFLMLLNPSSFSELARLDSYLVLVFLLPATLGLVVEGATQMVLRRCPIGPAVLCVFRNLGTGLVSLAVAWLILFGTSWFDSWGRPTLLIVVCGLLAIAVFGFGGLFNSRSQRQGSTPVSRLRAYAMNAGSVVISGVVGVLLGLGSKAILFSCMGAGI